MCVMQSVSTSEVATGVSGLAVLLVVGAMVVQTQRRQKAFRTDNAEVLEPMVATKGEWDSSKYRGYGATTTGEHVTLLSLLPLDAEESKQPLLA